MMRKMPLNKYLLKTEPTAMLKGCHSTTEFQASSSQLPAERDNPGCTYLSIPGSIAQQRPNLPLTLRLSLMHCLSPNVNSMPPDQYCISIRILVHCLLQALRQILFVWRILDHRNTQCIMISQTALLLKASPKPFDLLYIIDLKHLIIQRSLLKKESNEDSPLGVGMYAASSTTFCESSNE